MRKKRKIPFVINLHLCEPWRVFKHRCKNQQSIAEQAVDQPTDEKTVKAIKKLMDMRQQSNRATSYSQNGRQNKVLQNGKEYL